MRGAMQDFSQTLSGSQDGKHAHVWYQDAMENHLCAAVTDIPLCCVSQVLVGRAFTVDSQMELLHAVSTLMYVSQPTGDTRPFCSIP